MQSSVQDMERVMLQARRIAACEGSPVLGKWEVT